MSTSSSENRSHVQTAIWLASYPKSGNTWVRIFLHNLMRELREQGEGAQSINALHELTARDALAAGFARRLGKPVAEATLREIAQARTEVQADLAHGRKGPVYVKTHNAVATIEGFPTINFDITLAAVYIVRNPLDVAVSYAHYSSLPAAKVIAFMANADANIDVDPRRVYEFLGSWSFHAASWMSVPHRPVLLVRYEDMLASPERTFGRLASFLRLKPNAKQLSRAIEKSSFAEAASQEERSGFTERPPTAGRFFRSGKAGQWREVLSQSEIEAVVRAHAPMMMRFGYLTEDCGWRG
ncbi:sulfotransferase domain-containing protein [Rhodomicrobium lacus]|uniref:sulfotransferase domain-containing protein n=1 Tax=Rhodomicrobium lacus TaxID=2498452 RepID=UPI000F8D9A43|nr:sulfotransferase domain-containing protein [Rhodomicrobium lacus]